MEFDAHPLGEVVEDILDRRGVTPYKLGGDFCNAGHRVISAKLVKHGRIDLGADTPRFVDSIIYNKWMKSPLRDGDVVMTSEAPMGELAFLDRDVDWALGQRLFAIRPRKSVLVGRYLYYALATPQVTQRLEARASGTTVIGIRQAELRKVEVPVPPLDCQHAIAGLLGALDDRIDNLRATNATLEAIAQALFKSWFVDFDPVHAKAEGRAPAGMDAATAALFPSEFEDSELGLIPKGWIAGSLSDLVDLRYGKALKSADRKPGEVPVYGSGGITGTHDRALADGPTVIVGRKGTVGSLYWESRSCFPIDTVFYVVPRLSLHYCYYAMQRVGLDQMNTDAAVPGLNRANAYRQPVLIPPTRLLSAWDASASSIRRRLDQAEQCIETLTSLRDTLLPRLISGKLRLPATEPADVTPVT